MEISEIIEQTRQSELLRIFGIEVERASYASKIGEACRKNGLLISTEENVLMLFPALTITPDTLERGLEKFEQSL